MGKIEVWSSVDVVNGVGDGFGGVEEEEEEEEEDIRSIMVMAGLCLLLVTDTTSSSSSFGFLSSLRSLWENDPFGPKTTFVILTSLDEKQLHEIFF